MRSRLTVTAIGLVGLLAIPIATTLTAGAATTPPDALDRLWAVCVRHEEPECTVTATSTPASSPSPTSTNTPRPSSTAAPPSATPTPTASPTAIPTPTPAPTPTASPGIARFLLADLDELPTSGASWGVVTTWANAPISPSLADQDSPANVRALAAALVFARNGDPAMRSKVIAALRALPSLGVERALALGRELGAYVLAADLVKSTDAEVGYDQKAFYRAQLRRATSGGPANLIECHERRPNNWGTWCGATRIAIDRYIGDTADLARAATVFRGWLGDRGQYSGFTYGDTSWQADPAKPVGINPVASVKSGRNLDGVLPDDQRRGGSFTWPPPCENYVWEALQGATLQAELLDRAGHRAWQWSDQALRRSLDWLYGPDNCPATGDDTSTPWVVNHGTGSTFPTSSTSSPGKGWGFASWLYGAGS